jgi:hypothetical protein
MVPSTLRFAGESPCLIPKAELDKIHRRERQAENVDRRISVYEPKECCGHST